MFRFRRRFAGSRDRYRRRMLALELLERRELLAVDLCAVPVTESEADSDVPVQKAVNRFDVNGDCHVSPIDVLIQINLLNQFESGVDPANAERFFTDVNGDGQFTRADSDAVIGFLTVGQTNEQSESDAQPSDQSRLDVDGSGIVGEADADLIRESLELHGPTDLNEVDDAPRELDVNRDGYISALDVLHILNYLERQPWKAVEDSEDLFHGVEGDSAFAEIEEDLFGDVLVAGNTIRTASATT